MNPPFIQRSWCNKFSKSTHHFCCQRFREGRELKQAGFIHSHIYSQYSYAYQLLQNCLLLVLMTIKFKFVPWRVSPCINQVGFVWSPLQESVAFDSQTQAVISNSSKIFQNNCVTWNSLKLHTKSINLRENIFASETLATALPGIKLWSLRIVTGAWADPMNYH